MSDIKFDDLPEGFGVQLAGLSDVAQQHVVDALADATADGVPLSSVDTDALIQDSQTLSDARETVADLREAQDAALASGDLEAARDLAFESEWTMKAVSDLDPDTADGVIDAEADQVELTAAIDDTAIADAAVIDAAGYADVGMDGAAAVSADTAVTHADAAADHAASVSSVAQDTSTTNWTAE